MKTKRFIVFLCLFCGMHVFSQNKNDSIYEIISAVEYMPEFRKNKGVEEISKFIATILHYPASAIRDSIQGRVITQYWIDTLGNTYNHKIVRGIREDLDNEALRVIKLLKYEVPAMLRGKPIAAMFTLPVIFNLNNYKKVVLNDNFKSCVSNRQINKKSAIYVELLGNSATIFSVNYDRIIKEFDDSFLNATIGYGNYLGLQDTKGFNIPLSLNYTIGKTTNHHFEVGIGAGFNYLLSDNASRMLLSARIGYKYQRPDGGFYFRGAFTPIYPLFYFSYPEGYEYSTIFKNNDPSNLKDLGLFFHLISVSFGVSF